MGQSEGNSETWLVTYSDMVTLLLVFFVLLYTMTPGVSDATFNSFISYFQKTPGFFEQSAVSNKAENEKDDDEALDKETVQRWSAFANFLTKNGLSSEVGIQQVRDGVKITLSDSLTFRSGSAALLPRARVVLNEISKVLDNRIDEVEVQGNTDNVPIADSSRYQSNWHLGAARAVSVVQFIQEKSVLKPDKFKASSFGKYKPVATNDTPEGRRQNRRVEVYIREKALAEMPPVWEPKSEYQNKN